MNLDELTSVWRSQDAAPLHDVNKTLLHLALRQDVARVQKQRRIERWIVYVGSAVVVAVMAVFLGMMILASKRDVITGWDFAITIGGTASALLVGCWMHVRHRARAKREQLFGESLREQLNRRMAQLDDRTTMAPATLFMVLLGGILPMAMILLSLRVNQKSVSDNVFLVVSMVLWCTGCVVAAVWQVRRQIRDVVLPRKRQLEALMKEIDGQ